MVEQNEFISEVLKLLTPLGDVTSKKMFGGYGVFLEGAMFALVTKNDELFLKADDVSKNAFLEKGSKTHGKMPYYSVPTETLTGWDEMRAWAESAVEASRRAKKK